MMAGGAKLVNARLQIAWSGSVIAKQGCTIIKKSKAAIEAIKRGFMKKGLSVQPALACKESPCQHNSDATKGMSCCRSTQTVPFEQTGSMMIA